MWFFIVCMLSTRSSPLASFHPAVTLWLTDQDERIFRPLHIEGIMFAAKKLKLWSAWLWATSRSSRDPEQQQYISMLKCGIHKDLVHVVKMLKKSTNVVMCFLCPTHSSKKDRSAISSLWSEYQVHNWSTQHCNPNCHGNLNNACSRWKIS